MKKLFVVGLGPGNAENMSPKAKQAIAQSSVVVGYKAYVDLILDLTAGKTVISTGMMKEIERCKIALENAAAGNTTSLVCSGDAGVFGMASPVLELAGQFGDVEIEIAAGITAAMSGSAVLGSPLAHDFAVISLSDALTPCDVIENRLRLCARAGLCLALYNPQSKKRADALKKACEVLLSEMSGETVCGYVRNIGREGEERRICTLSALKNAELDMFCTVFIGNEATKTVFAGGTEYMVTPRGYEKKYAMQ